MKKNEATKAVTENETAVAESTVNAMMESGAIAVHPDATPETIEARRAEKIEGLRKKMSVYPQKMTIAELCAYRKYGLETWLKCQRTPSHTSTAAMKIIESALEGIKCGVITLGENIETGEISTIDGSSRIDDFIRYHDGAIGKKDAKYADLTVEQKKAFLAHELTVDWIVGTEKELIRDFLNLNSSTALTGGQKAVTHLAGSSAMEIVAKLSKHSIFDTMLSSRQIQKQEPNNILFLILANLTDCYNAKIDKVTEALANKDMDGIDVDRLTYIFDKIESADVELNKYKLVHLAHLMYLGDCWKSKNLHHTFEVDDMDDTAIGNAVSVNFATSGTNSADANAERIAKMAKKMYIHFMGVATAPTQTKTEAEETLDPDTLTAEAEASC